jgi:hypothetical protein
MREAADRFLEREDRPPTAKELQFLAGVDSYGYARTILREWRMERGISSRMRGDVRAGDLVRAAADRFLERMGRDPSVKDLAREGIDCAPSRMAIIIAEWRRERNVPVTPPVGRFRHDLARTAEAILASRGRAPTITELREAAGRGSFRTIDGFLREWCGEKGLETPDSSEHWYEPLQENVQRMWKAFRDAADRFLARVGRSPTGPELRAEAGQGSPFQAWYFLKHWRSRRGVEPVPPLRHDMERAAEKFLAAHGRAPMARELMEAVGRGSVGRTQDFLHSWREMRGLPRPGHLDHLGRRPRPEEPVGEEVLAAIDALAESLGRVPTGREIERAHGGTPYTTALRQREKWLEARGLAAPKRGRPRGSGKTGRKASE